MLTRILTAISSLLVVSGCAIHPVPEDVTGVNTFHIVKQIRCEARKAVIDFIKAQLVRQAEGRNNPVAQRLLALYETDPEQIRFFKPELFADYLQYQRFYSVIYSAAIGYSFDLTMTEQNDLGTNINFLGPWKNPLSLNLQGNFDRMRSNERQFTLSDTFAFLLARLNTKEDNGHYCDNRIVGPNYVYPIAGQIGVAKSVQTFFDLTFLAGGLEVKPGEKGPPTMVDDLKFTTAVDGTGMPKVVFAPLGSAFRLTDASLTGFVKRTDIHQVTVGLALDDKGATDAGALEGFLFPGTGTPARIARSAPAAGPGRVVAFNRITGFRRTPAEYNALKAIDQSKSKQIQLLLPQ
jgi:hypothetical protein